MTKLAFWIHQFVEFALGVVLLTEGARSGRPAVPMTAGALVLFVAATGDGPLQALGRYPRKTHRTFDLVTVGLIALAAALPLGWTNTTGRVVMGVTAGLWAVLIWRTNYRPRPIRVRRARRRLPSTARQPGPVTTGPGSAGPEPSGPVTTGPGSAGPEPSGPGVVRTPARSVRPVAADVSRATGRVVGAGMRAYRRRKAGS